MHAFYDAPAVDVQWDGRVIIQILSPTFCALEVDHEVRWMCVNKPNKAVFAALALVLPTTTMELLMIAWASGAILLIAWAIFATWRGQLA